MSYFSKNERDTKVVNSAASARVSGATDDLSTLGSGMQITGNIVCAGALQIFGTVTGDIHAAHLSLREGGRIEGKVIAPEAIIEGAFSGTIHGNSIKLQKTAVVEGEIFNKSLSIEGDARFEGVSRRLERAVEGPSASHVAAPLELVNGVPASNVTPLAAMK